MDGEAPAGEAVGSEVRLSTSRTMRAVFALLGFMFLGLGIAGNFVPGLPGTVNLLIALYFFSQSSERMYRWMLTNRWFGQALRDYKGGLGIPRRVKLIAVVSIVAAVALSTGCFIRPVWLRLIVALLGAYGVWFVMTRPTQELEVARRAQSIAG